MTVSVIYTSLLASLWTCIVMDRLERRNELREE